MNSDQNSLPFPTNEAPLNSVVKSKIRPKAICLFAGCGGLDLGFHNAGYDIVFANDIEASVKATYERNIGEIEIADICDIEKSQLPSADIVTAGIPCQPFSSAGNRKSTGDSRGGLFEQVMKVVEEKNPKVVMLENVRGFLSAKDGDGLLMPERIRNELGSRGYQMFFQLLNASNYEVPQNRHRVFILGVRNDLSIQYRFPEPIPKTEKLRVQAIISKPFPKDEPMEVWNLSPQTAGIAAHIPAGGSWKDVPYEELPDRFRNIRDNMKFYKSPNFYRKFNLDEIMGTVTAAATPENSGILHPLEPRRYSIREIARFQSFPDDFKFIEATIPQKYKMIGNAVPVNLAFHIAVSIKRQIFMRNKQFLEVAQ